MSQETERYQLENNGNTYLVRTTASGGGGADVEANPEGTATTDLTKLKVDDTIYGIPEGTNVVANPTLAGTEGALTGLQVGDTKYAVVQGLPTTGGTMTGDITMSNDSAIKIDSTKAISKGTEYSGNIKIGNGSYPIVLDYDSSLIHKKSSNLIRIYDETNGVGVASATPSAAYTQGGYQVYVSTTDPATKYNGYIYYITEA